MMKRPIAFLLAVLSTLTAGAQAVLYEYVHPEGTKVHHGFWTVDTGSMDWQQTQGLRLECFSDGKLPEQLEVTFTSSNKVTGKAIVTVVGKGWQNVMIPWNRFDTNSAELV